MSTGVLGIHDGLSQAARVPMLTRAGRALSMVELAALLLLGAGAAALSFALPDFRLGIPGNAILRSVFPMALGLALVPRRLGGCVMGASALATSLVLHGSGVAGVGVAAMTSLSLTGPMLDLALWRARGGWRLYLGFVLAGLGSNLVAFAVRAGALWLGLQFSGGGGGFANRFALACFTYPACGLAAGLISAMVWFHFRRRQPPATDSGAP